jgi:hypothetical protein
MGKFSVSGKGSRSHLVVLALVLVAMAVCVLHSVCVLFSVCVRGTLSVCVCVF